MGMPDTIVQPDDSFSKLLKFHNDNNADLSLGVYPSNIPERLAPVDFDTKTGRVKWIYDKPEKTNLKSTWNIGIWSDKFSERLHEAVNDYIKNNDNTKEILLSDIFNLAIKKGLRVFSHYFKDGDCYDLGNIDEFISLKKTIENCSM